MDAASNPTTNAICSACGGKCCRHMSGEAFPSDFAPDMEAALVAAFRSGEWVIDWWEGDLRPGVHASDDFYPQGYYIRPRVDTDRSGLYCPGWYGRCVFHTGTGCRLPHAKRPTSCRELIPGEGDTCTMNEGAGKRAAAVAWLPYHDVLLRAAETAEKGE
jgi:hypothetical protein